MPKHKLGPRIDRAELPWKIPMLTRDVQGKVFDVANELNLALREPQGSVPSDDRWVVSGLAHSSWSINHPDIMQEGESPLILRIQKEEKTGDWLALGQNMMENFHHTLTLARKKTPPGGDDWEDIKTFAATAATYFIEQKDKILALKQEMMPQQPPGSRVGPPPQPAGGPPGGMMASRRRSQRLRRRIAEVVPTPEEAMIATGIPWTGSYDKDRTNVRTLFKESHPDGSKPRDINSPQGKLFWQSLNVLQKYLRDGEALPGAPAEQQGNQRYRVPQQEQGATVGGQGGKEGVNRIVWQQMGNAIKGVSRLEPSDPQFSPRAAVQAVTNSLNYVNSAVVAVESNLWNQGIQDAQTRGLYGTLRHAYEYLNAVKNALSQSGRQMDEATRETMTQNFGNFTQLAHKAMESTTTKQARRASANLSNLRKAQKIARQLERAYGGEKWFLGTRVINDRDGIGLGLGLATEPPRRLRGSLEGIPLIMEGPGVRIAQARREKERHFALAMRLAAQVADEMGVEIPTDTDTSEMDAKELKRHQRLVKRVHNYIIEHKRLYGSVRYLARKLKIHPDDLLRVLGTLIVEGKLGMTKKKKFQPLEPPYTPVPGIESKSASTNSVFGIDRGRSDRRVDQLLSTSVYQLPISEHDKEFAEGYDIRDGGSKIMPDPSQPN